MGRNNVQFTSLRFRFLALLLAVLLRTSLATCLPKETKDELLKNFMKNARNAGLPQSSLHCFQNYARRFAARYVATNETISECYDHESLKTYMVKAMKPCIYDKLQLEPLGGLDFLRDLETSPSAQKTSTLSHSSDSLEPLLRNRKCPGKPNSKAHRRCQMLLGMEIGRRCHCWSGCHFCCINSAIGGNDFCFELYCRAVGWCRW